MIRSRAVLVAIGIDWEGRRQVLGMEMANPESGDKLERVVLRRIPQATYTGALILYQ